MKYPPKTQYSALSVLAIVGLVVLCLALAFAPALIGKIINFDTALSVFLAAVSVTLAIIIPLYTKRCSLLSVGALLIGAVFYANSATCYTFGVFLLKPILGGGLTCSWGLTPNQTSHGAAMLILGLGMILIAARSLFLSKARKTTEKGLECVLLVLGVIQSAIGAIALMI